MHLLACEVTVTVGDSGLCCYVPCNTCAVGSALLNPFVKNGGFRADVSAPPPMVTTPQAVHLATLWYCVDWCNAREFEADSSAQVNSFASLIVLYHYCGRFCSKSTTLALLLRFILSAEYGGRFSDFSRGVLTVTFRMVKAARDVSPVPFLHVES